MTAEKAMKTVTEPEAQLNMSERFAHKVIAEFGGSATGALQITDYQRSLIQNYFIGIDRSLKAAEDERLRKNENNSDTPQKDVAYIFKQRDSLLISAATAMMSL